METDIRNSLETAEIINLSDLTSVLTGSLSQRDNTDFFRFDLFRRSSFDLDLTQLTANADVSLLNSRGEVIAVSDFPNLSEEKISATLNPDRYFIQVNGIETNTNYSLSLVATQAVPNLVSNNGLSLLPGEVKLITRDFLQAVDGDRNPDEIIYRLETIPEHGSLDANGNRLETGDFFTQGDLDRGVISYTSLSSNTVIASITNQNRDEFVAGVSGNNAFWNTRRDFLGNFSLSFYNGNTEETIRLTGDDLNDIGVDIDGDQVLFNSFDGNDSEVYIYNAIANTTTQLTDNDTDEFAVAIDGNNIIWNRISETTAEAFVYNGTTGEITSIQPDFSSGDEILIDVAVAIKGDHVIGNSFDGNDLEIFLYDDVTKETSQLTENNTDDVAVDISQDLVIGNSFDGNDTEVFVYDLATEETTILTNNDLEDTAIAVFGTNIIWNSFDGNDTEVFLHDASTNTTTQLTDNNNNDGAVGISETHVVWNNIDSRGAFVYNLESKIITTQLTNNLGTNLAADISGQNLVWTQSSFGTDILLGNLAEFASSDSFNFTVADGLGGVTEEQIFDITIEI